MARVELEIKKEIGQIKQIKKLEFEIPDKIFCPDDGDFMNYSSYHMTYICMNPQCRNHISGTDFVKQELSKNGMLCEEDKDLKH